MIANGVRPAIDGDRVAWLELFPWPDVRSAVATLDLTTGDQSLVSPPTALQNHPTVLGDRIVFTDRREASSDVFLVDVATGIESRLTTTPSDEAFAVGDGERVAWRDNGTVESDRFWDVVMHNLATGETTRVTADPFPQDHIDISGDRIVWTDTRPAEGGSGSARRIMLYEATTGETRQLTSGETLVQRPAIDGDRVVWEEHVSAGRSDIRFLDLATGETFLLDPHSGHQRRPTISGDRVVWEEDRYGGPHIFGFDLSAGEALQLSGGLESQSQPSISGDRVVWLDRIEGRFAIVLFQFE